MENDRSRGNRRAVQVTDAALKRPSDGRPRPKPKPNHVDIATAAIITRPPPGLPRANDDSSSDDSKSLGSSDSREHFSVLFGNHKGFLIRGDFLDPRENRKCSSICSAMRQYCLGWTWLPNHCDNRADQPPSGFNLEARARGRLYPDPFVRERFFWGCAAIELRHPRIRSEIAPDAYLTPDYLRANASVIANRIEALMDRNPNLCSSMDGGGYVQIAYSLTSTSTHWERRYWLVAQCGAPKESATLYDWIRRHALGKLNKAAGERRPCWSDVFVANHDLVAEACNEARNNRWRALQIMSEAVGLDMNWKSAVRGGVGASTSTMNHANAETTVNVRPVDMIETVTNFVSPCSRPRHKHCLVYHSNSVPTRHRPSASGSASNFMPPKKFIIQRSPLLGCLVIANPNAGMREEDLRRDPAITTIPYDTGRVRRLVPSVLDYYQKKMVPKGEMMFAGDKFAQRCAQLPIYNDFSEKFKEKTEDLAGIHIRHCVELIPVVTYFGRVTYSDRNNLQRATNDPGADQDQEEEAGVEVEVEEVDPTLSTSFDEMPELNTESEGPDPFVLPSNSTTNKKD